MTARPALFPEWATNASFSTGPQSGQPTKVAPDAGLLADGNIQATAPPPQKFNYWQNHVATWLHYVDEVASLQKTVTATTLVANTNNLNPGVDFYAGSTELLVGATGAFDLTGIAAPSPETPLLRRIRNRLAQPITLKNQNGSSTAANRFAVSSGSDYVLAAGSAVWIAYDVIDDRWVVQVAGSGGGGAGNLTAVLTAGPSAGGLNVTDVGYFASLADLSIRRAGTEVLASTSTYATLRAPTNFIVLASAANQICAFSNLAGTQGICSGAAGTEFVITADQPGSGHGTNLLFYAGLPQGSTKHGGRVKLRGSAPTSGGNVGGTDILHTATAAVIAAFDDSGITFSPPLTVGSIGVSGNATVGGVATVATLAVTGTATVTGAASMSATADVGTILSVHGVGAGTTVSSIGDVRLRNAFLIAAAKNGGGDANIMTLDTANALIIGGTSVPYVALDANTLTQIRIAGTPYVSFQLSSIQAIVPIRHDAGYTSIKQVAIGSVPTPSATYYNFFVDAADGKFKKKDSSGTVVVVGTET
jgi:hypothetical protein